MKKPRGTGSWSGTVLAAALITAATAPGQTAGLSPFTDPLIEQLEISRTDHSLSYLKAEPVWSPSRSLAPSELLR
ncbi:hypothetical protein ACX80Z_15755 [Arthrobacter sp. TMT4-20]